MAKDNSSSGQNINASLKKLADIASWFDEQEEIDVELGLVKVKEGTALIKELKSKLKSVENEFEEIKKSLNEED